MRGELARILPLGLFVSACTGAYAPADDAAPGAPNQIAAPVAAPAPPTAVAAAVAAPLRTGFALDGAKEQGGLVRGMAPSGTVALSLDGKPVAVAPDGRFVIGFDRDQTASATLSATMADGRTLNQELRIAPRAWSIEHVNVARRPSSATADYLRRRQAELARIAGARSAKVDSDGWRQPFIWPVKGRITGVFGSQRVYRGQPGSYHSGVDVAPGAGVAVVAPADGVVVLAGPPMFSLEGNLVIIDHGMGLNSAFLHLADSNVREGQSVKQGQLIGTVGATGRATGPHLHWSMKWNDHRIDPQSVVTN